MVSDYGPLKPNGYIPRIADDVLESRLSSFGAVEVCGTRWCGKSWTAAAHAKSIVRVDDMVDILEADPSIALLGEAPVAIDEWQDVPTIWNRVRHAVDDSGNEPGHFILTGSSSPAEIHGRHSGAGRISRVRMRTMSLTELGLSSRSISLARLFEGEFATSPSLMGLPKYANILCHGGWPALVGRNENGNEVAQYLDLLFDVSMKGAGKDPRVSRRVAMSLARNVGCAATLKTISADVGGGDRGPTEATVSSYLEELRANYFFDDLAGWDAPVRSRSRLRTKPKRYLDDPSMAASLLGVNPTALLGDGQLMGALFENLAVHDLWVYAMPLGAKLYYYGDSDGLEVDVVVELRDGRWGAIEIKLSEAKVPEAVANLERLEKKVTSNPLARGNAPSFKAVIVAVAPYARRIPESGVYVVPLDTLAP